MKNIIVFASGSGTNAENIIRYFSNGEKAKVSLVLSNNSQAFVLERAKRLSVDTYFFDRRQFYETGEVLEVVSERNPDLIVLAGFLWLVPSDFIEAYRRRIINIHPALLPEFGGKGMYGEKVHSAVISAGKMESGITIHYVNEVYDSGDIIFQARCPVSLNDTAETLAKKVHSLEYIHYPVVIEEILDGIA